jgi:signal transduction histidine kinase
LSTDVGLYAMTATKKGLQFEEDVDKLNASLVLFDPLDPQGDGPARRKLDRVPEQVDEDLTWQVADTGIGIPKETIPALFQPFQCVLAVRSELQGL